MGAGKYQVGYEAALSIWVRWLVSFGFLIETNYRVDYGSLSHTLNTLYIFVSMAVNGYVHLRLRSNRTVKPLWLFALSAMDIAVISFSVSLSGAFASRYYVVYYPVVAIFAWVFASPYLGFLWATTVTVVYVAISLVVGPGLDIEQQEEKFLFYRVLALYAVVYFVNIVTRFERLRRYEAMQRERELQRERIEISQTIHDTAAQSAYMIGLGVETAIELADETNEELNATLAATSALAKSAMWELRRPIDAGHIFEGRELGRVLRTHTATFTTITSVPVDMIQSGAEPPGR